MTLHHFNSHHKIQAISYDKFFYLLKIFSKRSAFSKKSVFLFEHFLGELVLQIIFNQLLLFLYFCVMWHKHYINKTRHSPPRRMKIFYLENWASFLTSFSHVSVLLRNTFKKVSSLMQVHSHCLNEKCRNIEFFSSVFSYIWTKYMKIRIWILFTQRHWVTRIVLTLKVFMK